MPAKFDRCVSAVRRSLRKRRRSGNAYAICTAQENPAVKDLSKAKKLLKDFSGHDVSEVLQIDEPKDKTGLVVGQLLGVPYRAVKNGKADNYYHEFKPKSRPLLVASSDGKTLRIVGGRFEFTRRGIEDRDTGANPMPSIMVVNPSGAHSMSRRRKRRMPPGLKAYWASRRAKRNPHRRSRGHRRHRHHFKMNPSLTGIRSSIMPVMREGLIGAAGGIGNDVLYGLLTNSIGALPTVSANPAVATAAKFATAILIGIIGDMVLHGRGQELAVGAATVTIHDFVKLQIQQSMPGVPLGDYMTQAPTVGFSGNGRGALTRFYKPVGSYLTGKGSNNLRRIVQARPGMGQYLTGFGDTTFANGIPMA
jgi:hypothetical protein